MDFIFTLIITLVVIALGVAGIFVFIHKRRQRLMGLLKLKLFSLQFSKGKKEETELIKEISRSEQFFNSLSKFKDPVIFEAAVPYIGEEICFYAAVPAKFTEAFISQIHAVWSDVLIEDVGDYSIFHHDGVAVGGRVVQKDMYVFPARTYQELEADTFQSILGGLSEVNEVGEGGAIQLVLKPAGYSVKKEIKLTLKNLKKGKKLDMDATAFARWFHSIGEFFENLIQALFRSPSWSDKKEEKNEQVDENLVQMVQKKIDKPLFEVNIRIMASGSSQLQAESIYNGVAAGFSQFASPERNDLNVKKARNIKKLARDFVFRSFNDQERIVMNSEEVTSVFHFPTPFTKVPKVKYLRAKQLPAPPDLSKSGTLLGENMYRGEKKEIYISDDDRHRHLYIVGQTGTGKTNFLTNLVSQDVIRGKGVALLDPHGDSIQHILGLIPKNRYKDVILFDPTSLDNPMGLNMLEYDLSHPEQKTFIINELIGIFDKLYDLKTTGGPMFEQYMRNALLLLMEDAPNEPATLTEVPRVFSDPDYRNRKLKRISNPSVVNFWRKEAEKAGGEMALSNVTPYITSKFNNFIANDYMRVIVGQTKSAFDFRKVMDEGKILLVNLSKGKIGELNANLLGMIIIGKIMMAALGRADIPESKRRDFNLFIDEFQNFTTESISTILSEARKYHLSLTVAHQFISQLPEGIRNAVFGNTGSILSFRVGAQDAEFLVKQFKPHLDEGDLINIDNFNVYAKLLVNGRTTDSFNIHTFPAPSPDFSRQNELELTMKNQYGRSRQEVEEEITNRLRD